MAATLHDDVDDGILTCPSLKHAEAIIYQRQTQGLRR